MKTIINLSPTPNQTISANITDLAGDLHILELKLRTLPNGSMIADVAIDYEWLVYGVKCINKMPLLLGIQHIGNLYFISKHDETNPVYSGLGDKYILIYDNDYQMG